MEEESTYPCEGRKTEQMNKEGLERGKIMVWTRVEYFPKCFNLGNFFLEGMVLNQREMRACNCGIHLWAILRAGKMYLEI